MGVMKRLAAEVALVESKELVIRPNKRRHKAISTLGGYRRVKERREAARKQAQAAAEACIKPRCTSQADMGK